MKKVSAEVLNLDVEKLIEMLNAALCEEWLAYYQYWVGARIMEGPMRIPIGLHLPDMPSRNFLGSATGCRA